MIFKKIFTNFGSGYVITYYDLSFKNELLQKCKNVLLDKKYDINTRTFYFNTKYEFQIEAVFEKNYYKLLSETKKAKELDEKYQYFSSIEEAKISNIQAQEQNPIDFMAIIKVVLFIAFLPIALIVAILSGTLKSSK